LTTKSTILAKSWRGLAVRIKFRCHYIVLPVLHLAGNKKSGMDKTLRVLHLEDDPDLLNRAMLGSEGLRITTVVVSDSPTSPPPERDPFDIILADYTASCSGLQAGGCPQQVPAHTVPSGVRDHRRGGGNCMSQQGATDYVLKLWLEDCYCCAPRGPEAQERTQREQAEVALVRREHISGADGELADVLTIDS
jgi:hypothetical protein